MAKEFSGESREGPDAPKARAERESIVAMLKSPELLERRNENAIRAVFEGFVSRGYGGLNAETHSDTYSMNLHRSDQIIAYLVSADHALICVEIDGIPKLHYAVRMRDVRNDAQIPQDVLQLARNREAMELSGKTFSPKAKEALQRVLEAAKRQEQAAGNIQKKSAGILGQIGRLFGKKKN